MSTERRVNMSHPVGCRHYFHEDAAVTFREPAAAHRNHCQRPEDSDGHQYQRLYFTASRRWAFLCVHPFGGTNTHATYVSPSFATSWLIRNGYDPTDAKRYARTAQVRRRQPSGDNDPAPQPAQAVRSTFDDGEGDAQTNTRE